MGSLYAAHLAAFEAGATFEVIPYHASVTKGKQSALVTLQPRGELIPWMLDAQVKVPLADLPVLKQHLAQLRQTMLQRVAEDAEPEIEPAPEPAPEPVRPRTERTARLKLRPLSR
jgi:hypothetical protein